MEVGDRRGLREDVALMRELGVVEWGGVKLGPAPVKALPPLPPETDEERYASRLSDLRGEYRELLAGNGVTYSDEQIDAFIPERLMESIRR